ncbi:MAG TPA: PAS domain-containing protein, partial [Methanomassiliicoccales archaeon]|nr:PAS domain-containing protein [Methanomassiliicoccales archaeon]
MSTPTDAPKSVGAKTNSVLENDLETSIDGATSGLMLFDDQLKLVWSNPAVERMFGLNTPIAPGRVAVLPFPPDVRSWLAASLRSAQDSRSPTIDSISSDDRKE